MTRPGVMKGCFEKKTDKKTTPVTADVAVSRPVQTSTKLTRQFTKSKSCKSCKGKCGRETVLHHCQEIINVLMSFNRRFHTRGTSHTGDFQQEPLRILPCLRTTSLWVGTLGFNALTGRLLAKKKKKLHIIWPTSANPKADLIIVLHFYVLRIQIYIIFDKNIIKCFCVTYFETTNSSEMLGWGSSRTLALGSRSNAVPTARED